MLFIYFITWVIWYLYHLLHQISNLFKTPFFNNNVIYFQKRLITSLNVFQILFPVNRLTILRREMAIQNDLFRKNIILIKVYWYYRRLEGAISAGKGPWIIYIYRVHARNKESDICGLDISENGLHKQMLLDWDAVVNKNILESGWTRWCYLMGKNIRGLWKVMMLYFYRYWIWDNLIFLNKEFNMKWCIFKSAVFLFLLFFQTLMKWAGLTQVYFP